MSSATELLRRIPPVDRILRTPAGELALASYHRIWVAGAIREVIEAVRRGVLNGAEEVPSAERIMVAALARMQAAAELPLRRVINATGVGLHTNLGRAALAPSALAAVQLAGEHCTNLELDLGPGTRGEREAMVRDDLTALTRAEAVTVVNNNAAAVLLALSTLARGREVIVSRGELIEIGGSFRLPELMACSGAALREVGTTNRTHPRDYAEAITERTALLLKVRTSNYRVVGFTADVELAELVAIGREHKLPVIEDLGSGALIDLAEYGLPKEPVVRESIAAGADLVTFSGDKLLGGPQAGIIAGRAEQIERLNRNPLKRALRCDKLTLAALAATVRLYRTSPDLRRDLPALRWLARPLEELEEVGAHACRLLQGALGNDYRIELVESVAEVGSGALPQSALPSRA
ncbi:MAG TPA: L-seryl-tRNA(Sec) selenium transferase, partial [Terriglobales bacterium]|nr:L-seryl-tRNA(Sec) selenium transferase [Terriglobales bacterium]